MLALRDPSVEVLDDPYRLVAISPTGLNTQAWDIVLGCMETRLPEGCRPDTSMSFRCVLGVSGLQPFQTFDIRVLRFHRRLKCFVPRDLLHSIVPFFKPNEIGLEQKVSCCNHDIPPEITYSIEQQIVIDWGILIDWLKALHTGSASGRGTILT